MHHRAPIPSNLDLDALEAAARARLPRPVYDYFAGGADDERSLADNRTAWDRYALLPRVLVDVSVRDLGATVLGRQIAAPLAVAPMAYQGLAHPEGECATARATGAAGLPMILSTFSTFGIDEVRAATAGPVWFQLYVITDRGATRALVERAEAAGASALVVTVDAPVLGNRRRDAANDFRFPADVRVGNFEGLEVPGAPADLRGASLAAYFGRSVGKSLNWDDLAWLQSICRLPLVLKGILAPDDVRLAAQHGARAVVISNHGGRQLDGVPAPVDMLAEAVEAAGDALEVWVDGGVRRGTDIAKALALGARLVLVGRPILWGLAAQGEAGVGRVLEGLLAELDLALALCGCPTPHALGRGHVRPAAAWRQGRREA